MKREKYRPLCRQQTGVLAHEVFVVMLTWNQSFSSVRLTGYGIHHCFARSVLEGSATHLHYYALAAIATASCMVVFPVVGGFGRRGGLLTFMIITALASLLQLGLLNCKNTNTHIYTNLCCVESISSWTFVKMLSAKWINLMLFMVQYCVLITVCALCFSVIGKYSLRHDEGNRLCCVFSVWYVVCHTCCIYLYSRVVVLRDTLNRRFSYAFSIIGMFSSHAVSTLSIFYCAEITPTVIRSAPLSLSLSNSWRTKANTTTKGYKWFK